MCVGHHAVRGSQENWSSDQDLTKSALNIHSQGLGNHFIVYNNESMHMMNFNNKKLGQTVRAMHIACHFEKRWLIHFGI